MKKLPSSLLFLSAAVFLTVSGSLDIVTFLAIIACAICSAICLTNQSIWALVCGIGLISISLIMQVILSYKCLTCIKADILILSAVICLSLFQIGKVKLFSRIISGIMVAVMLSAIIVISPLASESSHNSINYDFSRYLEVNQLNGTSIKLDTSAKPVLLFSSSCSACENALIKITSIDPVGTKWNLVLTDKDIRKAQKLLDSLGYKGKFYTDNDWHGPVPTFIYTDNNRTITSHSIDDIISLLR